MAIAAWIILSLAFPDKTKAQTITPTSRDVEVSATIVPSKARLTIFGYSPANIPVSLTGRNVLELTTSDADGYFEFVNVPLPDITENLIFYPELCLQAYYKEVSTQPTCLPKIPAGQNEYKIGPVLISPILVIEKSEALVNSQIKATGKAIPNSSVFVYLAKEKSQGIINLLENIKIIRTASAYYLPKYEITSDENGSFEFNLPTESQAKWRIFTAYSFQNQNSPKSNTLSYEVKSPFLEFLNKITVSILGFVFENPITTFITFEVILIIILIFLIKKEKGYHKKKKLAKKKTTRK